MGLPRGLAPLGWKRIQLLNNHHQKQAYSLTNSYFIGIGARQALSFA
jgi:hypothetical protein